MTTSDGDETEGEEFLQLMRNVARTPDVSALRRDVGRGTELIDRFVIQRPLGEGGMGRVFAAYDRQRQFEVAIKMLGVLTPHSIVALKREFRVAAELVHPNLVRLYELFSDGDEWFFAMELLDGLTLGRLMAARPGDAMPLIRHVFKQLARALAELHKSGTVHGDLKPSNFLIVGPEQRVVLLDFGVARPLGHSGTEHTFAGTREYASPEQLRDGELTEASDWYSFGVVLYQSLTRRLPEPARLRADLQGAPPELTRLCLELLRTDPAQRPQTAVIQAVLGAEESPSTSTRSAASRRRFFGRGRERALLLSAFEAVAPGQPQIVIVRGDSGLGKTALVDQFVSDVTARGTIVLRARCRERELTSYKAIDGLIDDLVLYLDQLQRESAAALLPEGIADLTRLFPSLRTAAAVVARSARDSGDASDQSIVKQRAIAAFRDLIDALSSRAPVVLWIDDLQWSDVQSAALLAPIFAPPKPVGLLLVGGCRSTGELRGTTVDALYEQVAEGLPRPLLVDLAPLTPVDAESLASDLLPDDATSQGLAREIARDAEGSPLFIAELAHQTTSAPSAPVSRSLTQLVRSRVVTLPADARGLLETAALAGMPLTRSTARRSRGLTPNREEEVIDLLRARHLIRTHATLQERSIDLYHDRIREIVLVGVPSETKAEHHLWLARALEAESSAKPELVASHFFAGGRQKEAGAYWVKAADAAFEALAFGHAAELYGRGAEHAALDAERLAWVRTRRAEALTYDGKGEAAAAVYLLAAEGCAQGLATELRRRAAEQLLLAGHLERGLDVVGMVLRDLRMRSTRSGWQAIPSILAGRARVRLRGMRFQLREASEIPERTLARVDASWSIACSLGVVDFMRGADFQNDHLMLALNAGEPRRLLRALTLEISYAATPGRGAEQRTLALLKLADSLAEEVDDPAASGLVRVSRGVAAYLTGRLDEALEQCQAGVATLRRLAGTVWETVTAQRFIVASLFHLGRLGALAELVPALVAEAEANGNLYASTAFRTTYSNAAWLVGDRVAQAREHLIAARAEWRAPGVQLPHCWMFVGQTHLALYTGQTHDLWSQLQADWPRFKQAQFLRIGVLRVQLWHLRAVIATCHGREQARSGLLSEARRFYAEARHSAEILAKQRLPMATPLADLTRAALDEATGDREAARLRLTRCSEAFAAQDMRLYAAAARMRLGKLLGGDEGASLHSQGHLVFAAQGVIDVERFVEVLAPCSGPALSAPRLPA